MAELWKVVDYFQAALRMKNEHGFCILPFETVEDTIALLKEQEPVKAIADGEDSYMCNNCGTVIGWAEWEPGGIEEVKYKFCPECGRAVEWDEPPKEE